MSPRSEASVPAAPGHRIGPGSESVYARQRNGEAAETPVESPQGPAAALVTIATVSPDPPAAEGSEAGREQVALTALGTKADPPLLSPLAPGRLSGAPGIRRLALRQRRHRQRNIGATVLQGASWNAAAQVTPVAINLVLTPFFIHGLGLEQYGLFSLFLMVSIFLGSFDGGIGMSAGRYFSLYAGRDDRVSSTRLLCTLGLIILIGGGALSAMTWLLAPFVTDAFRIPPTYRPESVFLLRTLGVMVTVNLLHNLFVALLQARLRYGITSKTLILSYVAWAIGVYVTVRSGYGLRGLGLSIIGQTALATLVIVPSALRYLSRGSIGLMSWRDVREFFSYAVRIQTLGIATLVNAQFDGLLIGAILPVRYVGLYTAGANVSTQFRALSFSLMAPASTRLANTFGRSGEAEVRHEMVRMQRVWVVAMSGLFSAGIAAAYFGIIAWLGPRFRISALVCVILLAGYALNVCSGMLTGYLAVVGRPGIVTRYGVLSMVINVVLTIPMALLGVVGIVAATSLGQLVGRAYLLRIARRRVSSDLPSFLRDIPPARTAACMAATTGMELGLSPIVPQGPLGLVLCSVPPVIAVAGYAASYLGPRRVLQLCRSALERRSLLDVVDLLQV